MSPSNPFESSRPTDSSTAASGGPLLALLILLVSIGLAAAYTLIDERILGTQWGIWPVTTTGFVLALLTVVATKQALFSGCCCALPTILSCVLAGLMQGWNDTQLVINSFVAIMFSIPIMAIGWIVRQPPSYPGAASEERE